MSPKSTPAFLAAALPLALLLSLDAGPDRASASFAPDAPRPAAILIEGEPLGAGESGPAAKYRALAEVARLAHLLSYLELPGSPSPGQRVAGVLPGPLLQAEVDDPISDGQFVWGPNVGRFDIGDFLADRGSPLAPFADDLACGRAIRASIRKCCSPRWSSARVWSAPSRRIGRTTTSWRRSKTHR
jgi:hypothetical protein